MAYSEATLYVPHGRMAAYVVAEGWRNFDNIEEMPAGQTIPTDTNTVVSLERLPRADAPADGPAYDLSGRRINIDAHGSGMLYIKDGRVQIRRR